MSEKPSSHFEELKQEVGSLDLSHIQRVLDFINGIEE
jgi:hypothetical protein